MADLWMWFLDVTPPNPAFRILAGGVVVLLTVAFAFVLMTLFFRFRNHQRAKRWTRLEKEWEPVLAQILAGEAIPQDLWRLVDGRDEEFFLGILLRYARRLRGEELARVKAVARPFVKEIAEKRFPRSAPRRAMSVQYLAILGLPEFVDEVEKALEDPAPLVAMVAARGLAANGDPAHVKGILHNMSRFDVWSDNLRSNMLVSIGPEAAPILREELMDPNNSGSIRTVVANALRHLKDIDSAHLAEEILESTEDRNLAAACLRILQDFGQSQHLPQVRKLTRSPDPVVRMAAVGALASLGSGSDVEILVDRLQDDSPWVALRAARGLEELGGTAVLLQLAQGESEKSELAREVLDI